MEERPYERLNGFINHMDMLILGDKLQELRDRKMELEERIKEVNSVIETTESALVRKMIEEEVSNFTRNGRQFVLTSRTYVNTKAGMMPALCSWMKGNDLGDMVKESVHPQTLQAWVKEQIEETGALPKELNEMVNVYEKSGITIRKK